MATISLAKPRLVGFGDGTDVSNVVVDSSGTQFEFNDLVTYGSTSGVDKATGGAADTLLAIAADPDVEHDSYYEPIPSGSAAFGDGSGYAQVVLLSDAQVEMSTGNEALATADLGALFALAYSGTDGVPFVDLSTSSTSGFRIMRVADPVHGGDIGDTGTRVVGRLTDDLCL
jgi:hypothetical protein